VAHSIKWDWQIWLLIAVNLFLVSQVGATKRLLGSIEGAFYPVVIDTQLIESQPDPRGSVSTLRSTKVRDCPWSSVEWKFGDRTASVPVKGGFDDPPAVNAVPGEAITLEWDGAWAALPPEQVRDNFAYVWHQCPYRWWPTRSIWYDGTGDPQ
jgi:hypothetical protein